MAENHFCLCFIHFSYLPPSLLSTLWLSYLFPIQSPFSAPPFLLLLYFIQYPHFLPLSYLYLLPPVFHSHPFYLSYCYSSPRNLQREYPPYPNKGVLDSVQVPWVSTRGHIFKLCMHYTDYIAILPVAHPHGHCA